LVQLSESSEENFNTIITLLLNQNVNISTIITMLQFIIDNDQSDVIITLINNLMVLNNVTIIGYLQSIITIVENLGSCQECNLTAIFSLLVQLSESSEENFNTIITLLLNQNVNISTIITMLQFIIDSDQSDVIIALINNLMFVT
ncbi:unnamed protein product, partial [marine sediment metagenome]